MKRIYVGALLCVILLLGLLTGCDQGLGRLGSVDIGCGRSICKDVGGGLLQP